MRPRAKWGKDEDKASPLEVLALLVIAFATILGSGILATMAAPH